MPAQVHKNTIALTLWKGRYPKGKVLPIEKVNVPLSDKEHSPIVKNS